jgi:hypothetical protein
MEFDCFCLSLGEIEWGVLDWIGLAEYRAKWSALADEVMNLWIP